MVYRNGIFVAKYMELLTRKVSPFELQCSDADQIANLYLDLGLELISGKLLHNY